MYLVTKNMVRRKVLRAGRSSLAVSLPRDFILDNKIKSGDELDVIHSGTSITVKCDKPGVVEREIDASSLSVKDIDSQDLFEKLIGTAFKQGIDKFKIKCSDKRSANLIRSILQEGKLNLYEEPDMLSENEIVIYTPTTYFTEESLENLTNTIIKLIYVSFDDFIKYLQTNAYTKEAMNDIVKRDKLVNDKADICRRMINKNVINYKSTTTYNFVDKLEKIGDIIKYMAPYCYKNKEVTLENVFLFESIKDYFYLLFVASKNFTLKKVYDFYKKRKLITKQITLCKDPTLHYYCRHMHSLVKDAFSDLMVKNV